MNIETYSYDPMKENCYIIDIDGETAVVDCGSFTDEIADRLKDKKVKYIMLTHGHFDHILGVYDLKQAHPEAQVVIHKGDANCLEREDVSLAASVVPGEQKFLSADIIVEEGSELALGNRTVKVMHTPGHTMGSVCYFIPEERTIITGDTLFSLTVGRTDLYGGSDEEMLNSITRLYNMEGDYDIYPGHHRATTMEYEKRRNRYMRRFR